MYPYGYYQAPPVQYDYNSYDPYVQQDQFVLQDQFDPDRQPQQLERRVNQLERENQRQEREINQLQRRLQRVNQRLRQVERRFNFPFTPFDGEY
ncbi:hypothetical protein [Neobacillus vireti]|uniref:hypothetical protein n=1 Tax=Neobacillus vireti TaxID=220686 RepID=UPI002FFEDCED